MVQSLIGTDYTVLLARIFAFLTAIPFHEAAHAFVSDKLGDPTARNLGRLSLNPIKHLDPWGFLAMMTIGIGWAKPVPVNPNYYKDRKVGMAITAAAGPLSNLLLAYVFMILYKVSYFGFISAGMMVEAKAAGTFFFLVALINVNLAVFNMLPIPPFDGSRIFGLVLPSKVYFKIQQYERYTFIGVFALLFILPRLGIDPIGYALNAINSAVLGGFDWATGYIDWIFINLAR